MALSRKRKKELKKLRASATDLWTEQRDVLDRANDVVREAARQLGIVSREEVTPRLRNVVDHQLVPAVASSYHATRSVVGDARNKVAREVLPDTAAALASALAAVQSSNDPRVQEVVKQLAKTGGLVGKGATKALAEATKAYTKVGVKYGFVTPPKKKAAVGLGGYALIAFGVLAVAGVAYAAWQTLRADDELWVLDESDDTELPE